RYRALQLTRRSRRCCRSPISMTFRQSLLGCASSRYRLKTCWREASAKAAIMMAQLSDDCFAFGGPMMSVDEAVGSIAARVTPVHEVETVSLAQADGRILARDISAPLPLPPFTNSAVDGYAVRSG